MPGPVLRTFGTFGPFTLTLNRDTLGASQNSAQPSTTLVLYLANGADSRFVQSFNDSASGNQAAVATATAILSAYAISGTVVVLGGAATAPLTPSSAAADAPYARSVPLTPGTPLPAGRGALVKGTGNIVLKLAGGGTYAAVDFTQGGGTRVDGVAVIDADLSGAGTGATVAILY